MTKFLKKMNIHLEKTVFKPWFESSLPSDHPFTSQMPPKVPDIGTDFTTTAGQQVRDHRYEQPVPNFLLLSSKLVVCYNVPHISSWLASERAKKGKIKLKKKRVWSRLETEVAYPEDHQGLRLHIYGSSTLQTTKF